MSIFAYSVYFLSFIFVFVFSLTEGHDVDTAFVIHSKTQPLNCYTAQFLKYRTLSGVCNNLERPSEGAANSTFIVQARPQRDLERTKNLPSARTISNIVNDEDRPKPNNRGMSELITFFGQLLDHTITNTDTNSSNPLNIAIPRNDPIFRSETVIPFSRSVTGRSRSDIAPVNRLTSYIDGASIYGVTRDLARDLREFRGGCLRLPNNNLPQNRRGQFLAGDDRATENPNLAALHLVFAREHNTVAAEIEAAFPYYNDEEIYQLARHIVSAEMQAITYHEFLPALTGSELPRYRGYLPHVNTGISTRFSTVAFRVGHTLLNSTVTSINTQGVTREYKLHDVFFNSRVVIADGIDAFFRGMMCGHASEVDRGVTGEVRNLLITAKGSTAQLDLVSLNIQRGRDNGVPSCNGVRRSAGLKPYTSFEQISSDLDTVRRLREAYRNIDDVDAWVCGIVEDHIPGSSLGPLFHAIIREQFTRLRDGDRFYFQRPGYFTNEQYQKLAIVRKLTGPSNQLGSIMRWVIARNTDIKFQEINSQPFFV